MKKIISLLFIAIFVLSSVSCKNKDESNDKKKLEAAKIKYISKIINGSDEFISFDTALMLAKVFGNTPNFWLNVQQRNDLWTALHSPKRMAEIEQVKPISEAAA